MRKLFNCFAKNLLLHLNEGLESDSKDSQKRKISKLQGHSKNCTKILIVSFIYLSYIACFYHLHFLMERTVFFNLLAKGK